MKRWIVFLLLALVISNGYWLYKMLDTTITLKYAVDSYKSTEKALEQAIRVANLNVVGITAEDALEQLSPTVNGLTPFEKEGCINVTQICLELDEYRMVTGVR